MLVSRNMKAHCGKTGRQADARPAVTPRAGRPNVPIVRPDYDEQSASMQDVPLPHCASS
jgi:hypothetical protein